MDRDRRALARVQDAVDVRGTEREDGAGLEDGRGRRPAEGQALLAHGAADHGDRAGGEIVVVEAGVLVLAPADHPGVDVLVVDELHVDAAAGVRRREGVPARPVGCEVGNELAQLALREVARTGGHAAAPTVPKSRAPCSAKPARPSGWGSTTGRSDP